MTMTTAPAANVSAAVAASAAYLSSADANIKKDGVYGIVVKVLLKVSLKFGLLKTWKGKPIVRCDLKVPMKPRNGTLIGNEFQVTYCDWDKKWWLFR
ncbi:hypothetical protein MTR_1g057230 [Medicago truncatula]|uniref:Uncharacterized protein n=1 Tax=Medicago truncatula TaxID=3880 RepID=A0A072VJY9_MEDTR|nr:hypothetical protein MTR_1g057230 [Medicago truncatula]